MWGSVTAGAERDSGYNNLVAAIDPGTAHISQVLNALFSKGMIAGTQPFVVRRQIASNPSIHELLLDRLTVVAEFSTETAAGLLAHGAGTTVLLQSDPTDVSVKVSAMTMREAKELADEIVSRAPEAPSPDTVRVASWHSGARGPLRQLRRVAAPEWREIAHNYPPRVRAALAQLISLERPHNRGKLVLLHGEPGTGKTTAIRALIREWENWCATHYVADPERLFADTGYLTEVISPGFGFPERPPGAKRWRLVVAEDSDDFLRASARQESGAALARLLNISDGILGQGSDIIILLTTNERLDGLHPALTRPGRCLAEIEFDRFSAEEGAQWLGDESCSPASPLTLAELIESTRPDYQIISVRDKCDSVGLYL